MVFTHSVWQWAVNRYHKEGQARMTAAVQGRKLHKKHAVLAIGLFLTAGVIIALLFQLNALFVRYKSYKAKEALANEQLEEQKEKQQNLKDYEKYTKTKEYTESQARSKLGLLYDNEIIFKEK